jgi:undecaprenyl-diphosphatase
MLHLNLLQVVVLSLLQGVTELFPISSLGHTIILPGLLQWGDLIHNKNFLPIIVSLHLGTSIALVIYFRDEWIKVIKTIIKSIKDAEVHPGTDEWIGWLIIIGIIPAGLLGVFLETPLKQLFGYPIVASIFLVVNGFMLLFGEYLRKRSLSKPTRSLNSLSLKDAFIVGVVQSFALIPGISRSGSSMVAGLGLNLSHEDAAKFAFLLGTPVISGAALLEIPDLFGQSGETLLLIGLGMILSGIAAYISTKYLLKYFEVGTLKPFGYYCIGAGILSLGIFLTVLR